MQSSDCEFVLAQINDGVFLADEGIFEFVFLIELRVGINDGQVVLQNQQRLVLQRAALEETAQISLAWFEF